MGRRILTVEALRDSETPEVELDAFAEGVDVLNQTLLRHTQVNMGIVALKSSRIIDLGQSDSEVVRINGIDWPTTQANMSFIITGRGMGLNENDERLLGEAYLRRTRPHNKPFGVATAQNPDELLFTVPHELGHMIDIRYDLTDIDDNHCQDSECIMFRMKHEEQQVCFCERCSHQAGFAASALWHAQSPIARFQRRMAKFWLNK